MAAIKLAIIFFTLSPLLGAYHARHIHDGCIYKSLDQRPPMVTVEEEPQPPPQSSSPEDTIYTPDSPNAPPSEVETIYNGDNPKTPLSVKLPPSHGAQIVYGGDYLKAQPSPGEGGTGGVEATYSQDNSKTHVPAKVVPSHDQTVYGGDYLNAQPSPAQGGTGGGEAAYGRDNPTTPPFFASEIQMEQDEDDQTVLSIASNWLLSYTTRIFNNW